MKLNHIFRTILSLVLTIVLCIALPVTALADSDKDKVSGDGVTEFDPNNVNTSNQGGE